MKSFWRHAGCGALVMWAALAASAQELTTVPSVDLQRYVGLWYEVAKYPNRFQAQCASNTTATYERRQDGNVGVVNRCLRADGSADRIEGLARIVDARTNAKLEVSFLPAWLRWLPVGWGAYWVLELAPDYSYAVVGEPSRRYLWILARTPTLDDALLRGIGERLRARGYDPDRLERSVQR